MKDIWHTNDVCQLHQSNNQISSRGLTIEADPDFLDSGLYRIFASVHIAEKWLYKQNNIARLCSVPSVPWRGSIIHGYPFINSNDTANLHLSLQ